MAHDAMEPKSTDNHEGRQGLGPPADHLEPLMEVVEGLPVDEEAKHRIIETVVRLEASAGPIPPPQWFGGYAEVLPSAPERLLCMAEEQARHRHHLERVVVESANRRADRGQWMALGLAVFFGLVSTVLILLGHDAAGAVLGSTTLVSLVVTFVTGQWQQKQHAAGADPAVGGGQHDGSDRRPLRPGSDST